MKLSWTQWLQVGPLRLRALFGARKLESELDEELQFHVDQMARQLMDAGCAPAEAQRVARQSVGGLEQCKEECRDARGVRFLLETWQDLRFAGRLLRKSPGFAFTAVAMLAVVLGANAVVYLFADALLFRPLPYGTPADRLVLVWEDFAKQDLERIPLSAPEVADLQRGPPVFEEAAAFRHTEFNLADTDEPERVHGAAVSWNLLSVLGVTPLRGRAFNADDELQNKLPVVLISEKLWRRRYAADPELVGREIQLSGRAHTVIGIMPAQFRFPLPLFNARGPVPGTAEIWKPIKAAERLGGDRSTRAYGVIARLRSDSSPEEVRKDFAQLGASWEAQYPESYRDRGFDLQAHPLRNQVIGRARPAILICAGAVFVLLLIAIANLIAWLLARANVRERELRARIALGAGSVRLFRQLATEGWLLTIMGTAGGLIITMGTIAFGHTLTDGIPLLDDVRVDREIAVHMLTLFVLSGFLLAGIPAWHIVAQTRASGTLVEGPGGMRSHTWGRIRDGLVVAETALALALLMAAGLLGKSFLDLRHVPAGFNPASIVTMEVSLPPAKYSTGHSVSEFFATAAARIASLPGVSGVAFTSILPLSGVNRDGSFEVEAGAPAGRVPDEEIRAITPDYFAVLQIPLLEGRFFQRGGDAAARPGVIVNQALAQRYWPAGRAVGQRIKLGAPPTAPWLEVIGVVGNIKHLGLHEPFRPELYFPDFEMPAYLMTMVVKTDRSLAEIAPAIRAAIRSIDPEQAVANPRTMERVMADSLAPRRLAVVLVGLFAVLALGLGGAGIYGVISNIFSQRRRELALRVAFGATPRAILALVFRKSLFLLTAGIGLGLPVALLAGAALAPSLPGVSALDPAPFAGATVLLLAVGLSATFLPALRAARLNAMEMLRCD